MLQATFVADFSKWDSALKNAQQNLKSFEVSGKGVQRQLEGMFKSFSGVEIRKQADVAAAAVKAIGGASKLTEAEQRKVNATVTEALAKYKALGQQAPAELKKLQAETAKVENATELMRKSLTKASETLSTVGRGLTLYVTAPLVGATIASATFSAEFQKNMTKVVTLSGVTEDQMQKMRKSILDLGPAVGVGPIELSKALLVITSTGIRGAEAIRILESAAKATAVGLGETSVVARAITAAVTSYGEANLSAAQATDILFRTVKAGGAEAATLAPVLGRVTGIAAKLGISFQELGTFIATFTRLGVDASEATTSLGAVMSTLLKPSSEAEKALKDMGLSTEALRQSVKDKGLTQSLVDLVAAFEGNDEALATVIPNIRALRGVMGTAGVDADKFKQVLKEVSDTTDTLDKAFVRTKGTTAQTFNELKAQAETLAIKLGDELAPSLSKILYGAKPVLESLTSMVKAFGDLPGPVQATVLGVLAFGAAAGPAAIAASSLAKAVALLAGAQGFAAFAAGGTAAAGLTAFLGVAAAVTAAGAAFVVTNTVMRDTIATQEALIVKQKELATKPQLDQTVDSYDKLKSVLAAMPGAMNLFSISTKDAVTSAGRATDGFASMGQALVAARKELAALSPSKATALAEAIKSGAFSMEELKTKTGLSEIALKLYEKALDSAAASSKKLTDAQASLKRDLLGLDDIKKAQDYLAVIGDTTQVAKLSADQQERFYDVVNRGLAALRKNGGGLTNLAKQLEEIARVKSGRVLAESFGGASKAMDQLIFGMPKMTSAVGEGMRAFLGLSTSVDPLDEKLLLISKRMAGVETSITTVPVVWGRNVRAMVADTETWDVSVRGFTETLASGFAQLAQIADGTFSAIARAIGGFVGQLDVALDAFAGFRDAFIKNGKQLKGLGVEFASSLASGILGGIAGIANSTQFESTLKNALGGAMSGAITGVGLGLTIATAIGVSTAKGLATAGIWGAVAGAIVGIFIGVFRGRATRQYMEDVGREWGGDISKGLAEKMRKQAKDVFGGSLQATEIFNLDAILGELGGLTSSNFIKMFGKLRDVFSMLETGAFTGAQAMEVLDKNFRSFADYVTKNGSLASARLRELIDLDKILGTNSQAISDFVNEQSTSAVQGIAGFVEMRKTLIDNLSTARKTLDDMVKRKAPSVDIAQAKKNVNELNTALAALPLTAEGALGFGAALAGVFADMLARGKPITEVLALLGPVAGEFGKQMQMAGLSGGAAFDEMLRLATIAASTTAGPALQAVNSLNAAYTGLWNSGLLTTEMFTGLNAQVVATRDALVKQGVDGTDALRLMQPTLQTIWELWTDQKLVIDDATKALLAQAVAEGVVGAQYRTVQEQMLLLTERMTLALEGIADLFGVTLPNAVDDFGDAIDNLPDPVITPRINWPSMTPPIELPEPSDSYRGGGDYAPGPGYAGGTPGLGFVDFGSRGTVATLHNREAVVPYERRGEAAAAWSGGGVPSTTYNVTFNVPQGAGPEWTRRVLLDIVKEAGRGGEVLSGARDLVRLTGAKV